MKFFELTDALITDGKFRIVDLKMKMVITLDSKEINSVY